MPPGRLGRWERWGLSLLLVWIGWVATASALSGEVLSPWSPYVGAPLALAAGVALGRFLARHAGTWAVTAGLVVVMAYLLVAVLTTGGPAKAPTGYANANAAFAVQLTGLAGLALLGTRGAQRPLLVLTALGGLVVALANRSLAAVALGVPLLVLVLVMGLFPARRHTWRIVAVAAGTATSVGTAAAIVALADEPVWPSWAVRFLDQARHTMWSDALGLWRAHPVVGAGPGTFEQVSTLGQDPDTASAHSSVLQIGAETGCVGVLVLLAIIVTGVLWAARGHPANAVIGVATWTTLVVHSITDHLVDFPAVVLAGGVVLGWAGADAGSEQLDVSEGQGPS